MKLYHADLSPNCVRARAVAFELGLALEVIQVDLRSGEARSEAILRLNPNGKVPVLVDGDFILWESRAITSYLASLRQDPCLHSTEPRARALVDQWSFWQAIHLGPAMQRVAFERVFKPRLEMGAPDEAVVGA